MVILRSQRTRTPDSHPLGVISPHFVVLCSKFHRFIPLFHLQWRPLYIKTAVALMKLPTAIGMVLYTAPIFSTSIVAVDGCNHSISGSPS
eukprot:s2020_g4.t1